MSPLVASRGIVAIRVLGPLEVEVDGRGLVVDTRKALAILALLAVEGRPWARDELAALLWPESDDDGARGALRRTLSVLRAGLGDRGLHVDRAAVRLETHEVEIDLDALRAAADGDSLAQMTAAVGLLRGPLLAGFGLRDSPEFDDWRAIQAAAVERIAAGLLDRLATLAEDAREDTLAVSAAARRVDLDPLDEGANRRLMRLLARTGDRSGAIRQYRSFVAVLERELGVAPLSETTALYEAIRDADPDVLPAPGPAPERVIERHPAAPTFPLVGRGDELATLVGAHAGAAANGRLVLVSGEAGIGKSRLARAFAAEVRGRGGVTLDARAYAPEAAIPYGPIVELLRSGLAVPDGSARLADLPPRDLAELDRLVTLPEPLRHAIASARDAPWSGDDAAARIRLLAAISDALTLVAGMPAGASAGLIVVEDLQWADDATRETLAYLARRLAGRGLMLLLTWRPEDLDDRGSALAAALTAVPDALTLPLRRLDRHAVEVLASSLPRPSGEEPDIDALLEESEGLPLYLVESLAADPRARGPLPTETPRAFRTILRDRLASVGETSAQVAAAAAVLGRAFDLAAVRATSGRSEEEIVLAVEELLRRGIVREGGMGGPQGYDFAHAKLRDAAYEATSLARRRLLHRRAAEWIRSDPASARDLTRLAQLARHERAAGRDAAAADAFRAAGELARAVFANREALDHLESALALGHPEALDLMIEIGELRTAVADYPGAAAILEAAAAVATAAELPRIELLLGRIQMRRGDLAAAGSHLDAAVEDLRTAGTSATPLLARAIVDRGLVAHRAGDMERATVLGSEALSLAGGVAADGVAGDGPALSAAERLMGLLARDAGDLAGARHHLERSLALAGDAGDAVGAIAAGNVLALVEASAGELPAAIARLERVLAACRERGLRHLEAAVENNLADQLHAAGRREESIERLKHAVAIFADLGGRPGELEPEIWKLVEW